MYLSVSIVPDGSKFGIECRNRIGSMNFGIRSVITFLLDKEVDLVMCKWWTKNTNCTKFEYRV